MARKKIHGFGQCLARIREGLRPGSKMRSFGRLLRLERPWLSWESGGHSPGAPVLAEALARLDDVSPELARELARRAHEHPEKDPLEGLSAQPVPGDPQREPELLSQDASAPIAVVDFEATVRRAFAACERGESPREILKYSLDLLDKAPSTPKAEPDTIASPSRSGGIGRRARFRAYDAVLGYSQSCNSFSVLHRDTFSNCKFLSSDSADSSCIINHDNRHLSAAYVERAA